MKLRLSSFLLLITLQVFSQDTIIVMHYNLLNYGNTTSYCPTSINGMTTKNGYLNTIIGYVKPDIFTVNEIHGTNTVVDNLLNYAMNQDGRTYYQRASVTNYSNSDICNMLYYNALKFTLYSQYAISTSLRDINLYTLYYNSPDVANINDTVFITFMVMHPKAGNTSSDAQERADMTNTLMNYLNVEDLTGNNLCMGDLNVYSSSEQMYQNMVNYSDASLRFYDPISKSGDWNNNGAFADYHTQSTHDNDDGCHASGGMDDRFDQILISNEVKNDLFKVKYVLNSYYALAQDGNHYNGGLFDSPTNYSVPSEVLSALYNNSDHLPVIMKLRINQTPALGISSEDISQFSFAVNNPVTDKINISLGYHARPIEAQVYSVLGKEVAKTSIAPYVIHSKIDVLKLPSGFYFLKLSDGKQVQVKKIVVK